MKNVCVVVLHFFIIAISSYKLILFSLCTNPFFCWLIFVYLLNVLQENNHPAGWMTSTSSVRFIHTGYGEKWAKGKNKIGLCAGKGGNLVWHSFPYRAFKHILDLYSVSLKAHLNIIQEVYCMTWLRESRSNW